MQAVFTGGSMLYGSTGRTDLVGPDATDELTHAQYHSVRRLARELPGDAAVFPSTGSAASARPPRPPVTPPPSASSPRSIQP
jgi:hydroxyacylglutathione hydrolase